MCGITGFVGEGSQHVLEKMTRTLAYRGPDDEGYFFAPLAAGSMPRAVALGFRRLAIIDLATGAQPMFGEDKRVAVIFNGEIYNYKEIRKRLEARHTFITRSDTEVIVHLYEEKGEEFVKELEGMFAIAVWDTTAEKLILARDRFGEKPLFYAQTPNVFLFGSELKALMGHPLWGGELDRGSLADYLVYEFVPSPGSIFNNVYKLEAGQYLTLKDGKPEVHTYWDIADAAGATLGEHNGLSESRALVMLDQRLDAAVKKMLVSDVPLGVFLSGGVDSSTVTYFAQKHFPGRVKTFSIGFEEQSFDESHYAERVAKRLGTDHKMKMCTEQELIAVLQRIYRLLDEPLADPSLLPTYLLSQFAREEVTVVLGGDGADELLMGYQTFRAARLADWYARLPQKMRTWVIEPLIERLPVSQRYASVDFRLKRFVRDTSEDPLIRNQRWISAFTPEEAHVLLGNAAATYAPLHYVDEISEKVRGRNVFQQLSYAYLKHYMQDNILAKVDRASMFSSLEVRAPFLDPSLAAWIFALPARLKLHGLTGKYLLKRLMAPRIGYQTVYRKKQGFQPPVARWLNGALRSLVDEHLNGSVLRAQGLFDPVLVQRIIEEHRTHKADHRKKLWTLLVFQMWREKYLK